MADGFIVRKGGVTTEQALAPTITEISTTETSITFTITNNDASTAVILYELDDATPDANSIELAAAATSGNLTVTGLAEDTAFDVYATANVTGKVKSNVAELAIETDPLPVYTAATGGTTAEYDSGGKRYKSHTFTSDGTFTVTTVGDATGDRNKADYLIIAGGASGGSTQAGRYGGGGGGAGGYRTTLGTSGADTAARDKITVTAQAYSIVVGAGGAAVTADSTLGNNGTASSALGVSTVGGGGGGFSGNTSGNGSSGGSGGGAPSNQRNNPRTTTARDGGAGTANEGFAGANTPATELASGQGGGGAGELGQSATGTDFADGTDTGGRGGNGLANTLRTGSSETRAGGGGGGGVQGSGPGGTGGGGNGMNFDVSATAGTANTGSGGGGAYGQGNRTGAAGGSGLVVIRYEIAPSV